MARIVERRGGWGNWIQIFSAVVSTGAGFLALALAVALLLIFPSFRRPDAGRSGFAYFFQEKSKPL
jgi:hypothetical protein